MEDILGIVAKEDQRERFHEIVKDDQIIPQGDVYLVKISDTDTGRKALSKRLQRPAPDGWGEAFPGLSPVGVLTDDTQLVPGTSMGSRHVAVGSPDTLKIYRPSIEASELEGPVIVATERFRLVHPEHAAHSCPEGIYQVLYQRDYATDVLARVQD